MTTPIMTKTTSIAERLRRCGVIDAAVETHGNEAADILNARFAAGEEPPATDYRLVFADLGSDLRSARDEMTSAHGVHLGVLAAVVGWRKQRDTLTEELLATFKKARHTLVNLAEPVRGFELLGVSGETLRDPVGLIRQVRTAVGFLDSPNAVLPESDLGISVDRTAMATRLGSGADGLDAVLVAVDRERKVAEATRQAKNDAIASYDRTFLYVARTLEGFFHLAGLHELADRVRPSSRRSGRPAADGDSADGDNADGEPAGEPSQEAPAGAAASTPSPAAGG